MNSRYHLRHRTRYQYQYPVSRSMQLCRLLPANLPHQRCLDHRLELSVAASQRQLEQDAFGNRLERILIEKSYQKIDFLSESRIERIQHSLPALYGRVSEVRLQLQRERDPRLQAMRCPSPMIPRHPELAQLAQKHFAPERNWLDAMQAFNHWLFSHCTFDPDATTLSTPVLSFAKTRRGVCQDFTHLMLACLRSLGFAARYVSGYLLTYPAEGSSPRQGADASHAWVEAYYPGWGWIGWDPTNDLMPSDEHLVLAYGRDYSDVSPIRGVILGGGSHEVEVQVQLTRLAGTEPAQP